VGQSLQPGDRLAVEIGPIAHGGHFIAHAAGRTLLVRHAIEGEQALIEVTDVSAKVVRADAVEILRPSPWRADPACPAARPAGCGGCDFQHVRLEHQRELKAQVIADAFRRQAGLSDVQIQVESLGPVQPRGADDGLRWRTRMAWQVDDDGHPGLHAHRSHRVVRLADCPIASAGIASAAPWAGTHPGARSVRTAEGSDGRVSVLVDGALADGPRRVSQQVGSQQVGPRQWRVDPAGFWQVHPRAPQALVDAVLAMGAPAPGSRWWDLYAGAGLFSAFLAEATGPGGRVDAVESAQGAIRDARRGLHDLPQVRLHHADVRTWIAEASGPVDGIVLDPPRSGAGPAVMAAIAAAAPLVIVYVACDPVALARDVAIAALAGYRVARLRAFDTFPMTHHVEVVAALEPSEHVDGIS